MKWDFCCSGVVSMCVAARYNRRGSVVLCLQRSTTSLLGDIVSCPRVNSDLRKQGSPLKDTKTSSYVCQQRGQQPNGATSKTLQEKQKLIYMISQTSSSFWTFSFLLWGHSSLHQKLPSMYHHRSPPSCSSIGPLGFAAGCLVTFFLRTPLCPWNSIFHSRQLCFVHSLWAVKCPYQKFCRCSEMPQDSSSNLGDVPGWLSSSSWDFCWLYFLLCFNRSYRQP